MNNLLGIDFGERFIGLALKKHDVSIPYAHKIIDTKFTNLISELTHIAKKESITKIIIGYHFYFSYLVPFYLLLFLSRN